MRSFYGAWELGSKPLTLYISLLYTTCMDEMRSNNTVSYNIHYHVVWYPKYRRKVLVKGVDVRLKQIIREVCTERDAL